MDPATIRDTIGKLTAVRKTLGWSEEFCAHQLGVTYSTLNRWERGESLPNSQAVLHAIEQFIKTYGDTQRSASSRRRISR